MSIEERALEKYPVKIVNYDEFSMFDMNENKRQRYIEICKEQDAITRRQTLDKVYRIITDELGQNCGEPLIKVIEIAFRQ